MKIKGRGNPGSNAAKGGRATTNRVLIQPESPDIIWKSTSPVMWREVALRSDRENVILRREGRSDQINLTGYLRYPPTVGLR